MRVRGWGSESESVFVWGEWEWRSVQGTTMAGGPQLWVGGRSLRANLF